MTDSNRRFPGYDVLAKRDTPSWNEQTRRAIDRRLALPDERRFFTEEEWRTLGAVCARIMPQPAGREHPVPIPAMIDRKLERNELEGYRRADMPPMGQAWQLGLGGIDEEARLRFGRAFHELTPGRQDTILELVQKGDVKSAAWERLPAKTFFGTRVLQDIVGAYYAQPAAWNEIGFGGPAAPRGYVRMGFNRRDPWEAIERPQGSRNG